jgi:hypothetical protein
MNDKSAKSPDRCREFSERIPQFLDGTLPDSEFPAMETHRRECGDCARALLEEERIKSLMSEIGDAPVPADFRDRVLRAWRVRQDHVKDSLPASTLHRLQIVFVVFAIVLLALPAARISLLSAASSLSSAVDNLPPEYREGLRISFELPSYPETVATLQTWQGGLFEWLGDLGSALTPWTGWLWGGLILAIVIAAGSFRWLRTASQVTLQKEKRAQWR